MFVKIIFFHQVFFSLKPQWLAKMEFGKYLILFELILSLFSYQSIIERELTVIISEK